MSGALPGISAAVAEHAKAGRKDAASAASSAEKTSEACEGA